MATKTEMMRERYERFSRGEVEGALDLWADDFVWEGDVAGLPWSGRYEGKAAAIGAMQLAVGGWDKFEPYPEEFIEQGDSVVVFGHYDVAKDDRTGHLMFVHLWRFRGEQIRALQLLTESLESARILKLPLA
ncbi:MAG TPA: nuclear transport factor 2 family protein [Nakamurella sp.]